MSSARKTDMFCPLLRLLPFKARRTCFAVCSPGNFNLADALDERVRVAVSTRLEQAACSSDTPFATIQTIRARTREQSPRADTMSTGSATATSFKHPELSSKLAIPTQSLGGLSRPAVHAQMTTKEASTILTPTTCVTPLHQHCSDT